MKHDFAWGDTRGIREIFIKHADRWAEFPLSLADMRKCGYPQHEGNEFLTSRLKQLIKKLTGRTYKYVLVTNGATNGLNAYLHAKKGSVKFVLTNELYFGFYPGIVKNAGMEHLAHGVPLGLEDNCATIIDSPSNPLGKLYCSFTQESPKNKVWDAAYFSPTYCGMPNLYKLITPQTLPAHEAMVGSMNKLTGLNGLRVGWLATDDKKLYEATLDYVTYDLCGVSHPSQRIAANILENVDLDPFYVESKAMLDSNRTEMSRLNKIFGNQPIPNNGMFALFEIDDKLDGLLEKASVKTMAGEFIGDSRMSVRINLANSNEATKAMVDDVLKADKL